MPAPSAEHAPVLGKMSAELLKASPKAPFFTWHVLEAGGPWNLKTPQAYITAIIDDAGNWIGGESLEKPENRIVAKYQEQLGWSAREERIGFAYSIKEAREITDLDWDVGP